MIPTKVHKIIAETAAEYGVTLADVLGDVTARRFSRPRQEAMRRVSVMPWRGSVASYPQIGDWFNRDHTTVLYACGRLSARGYIIPGFTPQNVLALSINAPECPNNPQKTQC